MLERYSLQWSPRLWKKDKQGVQILKAFAFCVVNFNIEHTKPTFKRKLRDKFKDDICTELCLKLWFQGKWYL